MPIIAKHDASGSKKRNTWFIALISFPKLMMIVLACVNFSVIIVSAYCADMCIFAYFELPTFSMTRPNHVMVIIYLFKTHCFTYTYIDVL